MAAEAQSIRPQGFRTPTPPVLEEEDSEYTISTVALENFSSSTKKRDFDAADSTFLTPSPKRPTTTPQTSPAQHTGLSPWIKRTLTLSPSAFRTPTAPKNQRARASCSLTFENEDTFGRSILNSLYQYLKNGIQTDDFKTLKEILLTIDNALWKDRNTNKENSLVLFSEEALILLQNIKDHLQTIQRDELLSLIKIIDKCINLINKFQNEKQKLNRLSKFYELSKELPQFQQLFTQTFSSGFAAVDTDLTSMQNIFDDAFVLKHAFNRCNEDLLKCSSEEKEVLEQLKSFLQEELKKKPTPPAIREYHFTQSTDNMVDILDEGIQVTDRSKYRGAFVSSDPEESFGEYGVTVSTHELGCFSSPDLSHKERRPLQEGSAIWSGFKKPVKRMLSDRVLVAKRVSEKSLKDLRTILNQRGYQRTIILPVEVERKLIQYQRELGRVTPISPSLKRTVPLKKYSEGNEQ